MSKTLEFFFDLGSPATYLAYTQLPALCAATGATLVYQPMLLGGVFKATGNASPITVPAKGRYLFNDLSRYAQRYNVTLKFNPHFPINTLMLMRAVTGMQLHQPERFQGFIDCLFRTLWVEGRNMGDPASGRGVDRSRFQPGRSAGPGQSRKCESRPQGQHGAGRSARRVRCAQYVCRQPAVLRSGPSGFCARSPQLIAIANRP